MDWNHARSMRGHLAIDVDGVEMAALGALGQYPKRPTAKGWFKKSWWDVLIEFLFG